MKKKVIAYLHTHWDREWYREFEVFRLRLLRMFDEILELLQNGKIPSFYFDGQTGALLDYLEMRPENEQLVRELVKSKKLFIGPCYCLIDEFLTDEVVFKKNLELGLKVARDFGCEDFVAYFADTFGHSKNMPDLLKEFGIDKCVVWRGVGDLPAEFIFNGVKTVNLVRGYFMDIFSQNITIEAKAEFLKDNLDKIAEKSVDILLLPIGGDHLGVPCDVVEQIAQVNEFLESYEIELSSIFEYFKQVDENFEKVQYDNELRDNSKTFTLQGVFSTRNDLKYMNCECTYLLEQADKIQKKYGEKYSASIEYAYKLLIQNQAHDGIYGCSTDLVHQENTLRYEKIKQIANTIIEELRFVHKFITPIMKSAEKIEGYDFIDEAFSVENDLLYDIHKVPITEDFKPIYTLKKTPEKFLETKLELRNGELFFADVKIEFIRRSDLGDTYNFAPKVGEVVEVAKVLELSENVIKTSFFDVKFVLSENLINFSIDWQNEFENKLTQVKFRLAEPIFKTYSEDLNRLVERDFEPDFVMAQNLLTEKGQEARTNFAPMQRYVGAQGFGVITKGLNEYEIVQNTLSITLLRSIGVISNPKNPARTTPAGPPIEVVDAQMLKKCYAEFSIGMFKKEDFKSRIDEVFPQFID